MTSSIEEGMARLEGAYEQINLRLARLEERVERGFEDTRREIADLRRDQRNQFYWLLGLLFPMWVTIVLAVLLKGGL